MFKRPPIRGVLGAEVGMGVGVLALVLGLFCGEVAGVARLHAPAPSKLGEEMGELLRKVDKRTVGGGSSEFRASMVNAMHFDENGITNPAVSQVVSEANNMAARDVVPTDGLCVRNWSRPCPDGWSLQGRDECLSPSAYTGPCKHVQTLAGFNVQQKHKVSLSCKSPWPCADLCLNGHDYDVCPKGWQASGDGFCESPLAASERTGCTTEYKFDEMSIQDKQELGFICGFEWKCKETCVQDYRKSCPEGWTEIGGLCLAPANYGGDCGYSINTKEMSADQKRDFAAKCAAAFPCQGDGQSTKLLGSNDASVGAMGDGPVRSDVKLVINSARATRSRDQLDRFASRFVLPSGPVDASGEVHF